MMITVKAGAAAIVRTNIRSFTTGVGGLVGRGGGYYGATRRGFLSMRWLDGCGSSPSSSGGGSRRFIAKSHVGVSSVQSPIFGGSSMKIQCCGFSTEAKTELLDMLAREAEEENEMGNTSMPSELADLKATIEQDWRIVDEG
jgi:hypothetical protein